MGAFRVLSFENCLQYTLDIFHFWVKFKEIMRYLIKYMRIKKLCDTLEIIATCILFALQGHKWHLYEQSPDPIQVGY